MRPFTLRVYISLAGLAGCLSVCLAACLSVWLPVCLSAVCLSVWLAG